MHFFCLDSGDWGHPSASIVCRFSRNLWERYTVLAEVEFCPLGASLFPSHQARYFCSLVVQGIASVLVKISVGVIGAELLSSYVSEHSNLKICNAEIPSLLGLIMPLGTSLYPSHQARCFCSLVVNNFVSDLHLLSFGA